MFYNKDHNRDLREQWGTITEGQWPIGTVLIFLYEYSIFFMVVPFLGGT